MGTSLAKTKNDYGDYAELRSRDIDFRRYCRIQQELRFLRLNLIHIAEEIAEIRALLNSFKSTCSSASALSNEMDKTVSASLYIDMNNGYLTPAQ